MVVICPDYSNKKTRTAVEEEEVEVEGRVEVEGLGGMTMVMTIGLQSGTLSLILAIWCRTFLL